MTIIGNDMAIIGQAEHVIRKLKMRGIGEFLNIIN
jgi:hypothetical protein